ncbi:flagellar basal body-associated FliL family protein [Clostridium moutaii]
MMENRVEKKSGISFKIVLTTLLLLIAISAGAYFGYNKFLKNSSKNSSAVSQNSSLGQTQQVSNQGGGNSSYLQQVVSDYTFDLSDFTVNLADEGGKNYLKISVFLGYDDKKLSAELTDKKPMIRDAVIDILRTKKVSDINPKYMDNIKMEIIQKINPMLEKGKLNNVYFDDILTQ